jgi:hypothetical protein
MERPSLRETPERAFVAREPRSDPHQDVIVASVSTLSQSVSIRGISHRNGNFT